MTPFAIHRFRWASLLVAVSLSACFLVRKITVDVVDHTRRTDSVMVKNPVKAHLVDGSTVVYPRGVLVQGNQLLGEGTWYDLTLGNPVSIIKLTLDSVVGIESFRTRIDGSASFGVSLLIDVGVVGVAVAFACAADPKCFGSCPTYYSDSAGTPVLEAEGFSYSVAPLFESRDVDRLRGRPDERGVFRLEVRNEAFETHYINHLELLEAKHAPGEYIVPDQDGNLLALTGQGAPRSARDRAGREVTDLISAAEGQVYATSPSVMARVSEDDFEDYLEFNFGAVGPLQGDSVALVLRLRNSLLNTVLLYDVMLGDPGARSLDWQAQHLSRVGPALELGAWYAREMGLTVEVWRGGRWVAAARIKDTGPVAWKDVAVSLANPGGAELRVRLRHPADNWRIDRVALAQGVRRPVMRTVPVSEVRGLRGGFEPDAYASILANDERYLQTQAGQAFVASWEVGPETPDQARTFLLASQGYYIEWVRRGWIAAGRDTATFRPSDAALHKAIVRWRTVQDTLEQRFFATRVPVR